MKLIYVYVRSFKNIQEQEFLLSDDYDVFFEDNRLTIDKTDNAEVKDFLYGNNLIKDLHIIVGRTGSGKTNLLQLIGMSYNERERPENKGRYFLLYKCNEGDDVFAVEVLNMYIPRITNSMQVRGRGGAPKNGFFKFHYNFETEVIKGVQEMDEESRLKTAIVNAFDRNAFAVYPYSDIDSEFGGDWIPRKVMSYAESYPGSIVRSAKEYVSLMPEESVKRRASFIIDRENWQYKLNVELPHELVEKEYWLYGERRQGGDVKSLADIPYATLSGRLKKGKDGKNVSVKERFLHDLLTDFAIYLRKVASSAKIVSEQMAKYRPLHDLGIEDPKILPDGKDITLEDRLLWLGQYIDYHTDERNGNKGLVWQECKDILDSINMLREFDDRYFTADQFVYPIIDIDDDDKRFLGLFEAMGQYHRDQFEVFPKEFLPYKLSYLSSGEYQYTKIWGALENAIELKFGEFGERGKLVSMKDLQLTVLMDEPETYLHPEYCREFIDKTVKVLERRNPELQLQLIITTHSPFMLSDTISSQVTRVDYDEDGECIVQEPTDKPYFAANILSIMADGFFLDYTIGEYSRAFLTEKFKFLRNLAESDRPITTEELSQVNKIRTILPYVGDEMIRHCFEMLILTLNYAQA